MPPKGGDKQARAQDRAAQQKKEQSAADKTFGLKNKNKSKAVQKYIKTVTQNVRSAESIQKEAEKKGKKEAQKAATQNALLTGMFASMGEARKATAKKKPKVDDKINLNVDPRAAAQAEKEKDKMDEWDQEKLESVVKTKHGGEKLATTTDIVCKFFLDAVEKRLYGWFWTCPNGATCKYKHCLPPGFVLKPKEIKMDDDEEEEETPIEEIIEQRRKALPPGGTPVTLESFKAWKIKKEKERLEAVEEKRKVEAKKTGGKGLNVMSGRDLFTYDPTLFVDDDGAADDYECEESEEEEEELPEGVEKIGSGDTANAKEWGAGTDTKPVAIDESLFAADADLPDNLDELDLED